MAGIPLTGWLGERIAKWLGVPAALPRPVPVEPPQDEPVRAIVVGGGRVGKLVSEMLDRHGVPHIVVDRDPAVVIEARGKGIAMYYGDAKSPALLKRCGIASAEGLIVSIATQSEIDEVIGVARQLRGDIPIIARARDASHARHLYALGVADAVPETIEASLQLSEAALVALGIPDGPVTSSIHDKRDELRHGLQEAGGQSGRAVRALRASAGPE
jgi:CPA2 family monovalent cation:H+ antiporter-2